MTLYDLLSCKRRHHQYEFIVIITFAKMRIFSLRCTHYLYFFHPFTKQIFVFHHQAEYNLMLWLEKEIAQSFSISDSDRPVMSAISATGILLAFIAAASSIFRSCRPSALPSASPLA